MALRFYSTPEPLTIPQGKCSWGELLLRLLFGYLSDSISEILEEIVVLYINFIRLFITFLILKVSGVSLKI